MDLKSWRKSYMVMLALYYFREKFRNNIKNPCTLLPHYFPFFIKLPLWGSMLIKFGFLIDEALWKMKNNEEAMCKVSLCILVFTHFLCKFFRFIYTMVSDAFPGLFQYCISRLYYLWKRIFFYFEFGNTLNIVNLNQSQQQPNFFVTSFM